MCKTDFASFKFQSEGRVQEGIHIDIRGFAGVIGHQSAILLPYPVFFPGLFYLPLLQKIWNPVWREFQLTSYFCYAFLFRFLLDFFVSLLFTG